MGSLVGLLGGPGLAKGGSDAAGFTRKGSSAVIFLNLVLIAFFRVGYGFQGFDMPFEIFSVVSELLNPKTFLIKLLSEGRDLACRLLLCLGTSLGESLSYLGFCFCSTFLMTLLITGCMCSLELVNWRSGTRWRLSRCRGRRGRISAGDRCHARLEGDEALASAIKEMIDGVYAPRLAMGHAVAGVDAALVAIDRAGVPSGVLEC